MADLNRRARNLHAVASAVTIYILAGVDINQISALGLRIPARFPEVFTGGAIIVFFWTWWKYSVLWKASDVGIKFRHDFLSNLHSNPFFQELAREQIDDVPVVNNFKREMSLRARPKINIDEMGTAYQSATIDSAMGRHTRTSLEVSSLKYKNVELNRRYFPNQKNFTVEINLRQHYRFAVPLYARLMFTEERFATQRMPHILGFSAFVLLILKWISALAPQLCHKEWSLGLIGCDPAGFFGLLLHYSNY